MAKHWGVPHVSPLHPHCCNKHIILSSKRSWPLTHHRPAVCGCFIPSAQSPSGQTPAEWNTRKPERTWRYLLEQMHKSLFGVCPIPLDGVCESLTGPQTALPLIHCTINTGPVHCFLTIMGIWAHFTGRHPSPTVKPPAQSKCAHLSSSQVT